jgi:HTH-type transcriptional regulator / antitoxin MqsA
MTNPVDPETGAPLRRDVRPLTLTYKGASITVDMPGWYGDRPDEGVFEPEDMKISDQALNRAQGPYRRAFRAGGNRRIRKNLGLRNKRCEGSATPPCRGGGRLLRATGARGPRGS